MNRLILKNISILPMTGPGALMTNGNIYIEGDKIAAILPNGEGLEGFKDARVIDGQGKLAMPGLVNAHTHAAMTLFRGYADDMPLMDWLSHKIWPLEDKLNGEDIYWGTMLCALEMIKSGTTTMADMYFFMDQTAQAIVDSGMRGVLSRGLIGAAPNGERALEEGKEFVCKWEGQGNGRITTMLGPHAPYTCPPSFLEKVMNVADDLGTGLHIHLAETLTEVNDIQKQYGKTPVQLMEDIGLFNRHVLAAHCVHLTDEEINILADRRVGVAHNPESNMKLASGIAPVPKMLAAGIKVALGTDGAASNNNLNMWDEIKAAALIHKVNTGDPTLVPAYQALDMATVHGADAVGLKNIGTLEKDMKADIILIDLNKSHFVPLHDIPAHLVYSSNGSDVDTVIINGQIVMENRQLLTIDEEKVMAEAQKRAFDLVQR